MEQRSFSTGEDFDTIKFAGSFQLAWPGIVLILISFIFVCVVTNGFRRAVNASDLLILSIIIVMMGCFTSMQVFYFTISGQDLIIRNHIFRWYRKRYALKDINVLILEPSGYRTSKALRVKSAGSRPWSFFAGSLSDIDWYEFEKALKKRGFPVENKLWGI